MKLKENHMYNMETHHPLRIKVVELKWTFLSKDREGRNGGDGTYEVESQEGTFKGFD